MSLPSSFKAALLIGAGEPLSVVDRTPETASLEPHEVAIKMTATAINPVDWKLREHPSIFFGDRLPAVLGTDASGTIHAKGSSVSDDTFKIGDRVFFQGHLGKYDTSSFQEYARTDAKVVGRIPDNITDEEAAGVALAGMAAAVGLYHSAGRGLKGPWDDGKAGRGRAIVVLGGSSSVGQYAVQFARLSGFDRVVTNASAAHKGALEKLGASAVLDRNTHSAAADFLGAIGDELELDSVYDAIGSLETQTLAVEILQKAARVSRDAGAGVVACVQRPEAEAVELGHKDDGGQRKVEIKGILAVGPAPEYRYVSEPFYVHVSKWLGTGEFVANKPTIIEGGVGAIEEALQKQKAGVSGTKVVVKF